MGADPVTTAASRESPAQHREFCVRDRERRARGDRNGDFTGLSAALAVPGGGLAFGKGELA
ncbi:hypothetical protein B0I33_10298 [Prauserella shujinwangii]|uniref:Uncharacterized protein n=1 Tax=Prauserella shujinwangii TaxID=1453103 RepID=A0A2T0M074_9PSEU|nr:hypothetical protein B0I33_10298 [Prauserella shujinwangii]